MASRATWMRRWAGALRDTFYPPVCVHCRRLVEETGRHFLCARCARLVHRVAAPHCPTCGYPFFGDVAGGRDCEHCRELDPWFREGRTAVLMRGPARSLVHEFKYHQALHVVREIELLAGEAPGFAAYLAGAVLVPVPLHPRKERERGFNQSRVLAEAFARVAGVPGPRVAAVLRRVEDTATQTRLDRRARQNNLKNAFAMAEGASITPAERIVLVDDVFTTGSTLNACAAVLRRAGCLTVDVATFGHG